MQKRKIYYMLHSGKNSHVAYYLKNYLRQCVPAVFYRLRLEGELRKLNNLPDRIDELADYIKESADIVYHIKIRASFPGFPHGYGTTSYTEFFRQLDLRHPMLFPKLL